MRVGVTATQVGLNDHQLALVRNRLIELGATELHHGDCIGGDSQIHSIARELGLRIVGHPPDKTVKRAWCECDELREPRPYIERNHNIVDSVDVMLAGPKDMSEQLRSGTWATVRYARKSSKPVEIIWPR